MSSKFRLLTVVVVALTLGGCATPGPRDLETDLPQFVALANGHNPMKPDELIPALREYKGGLAMLEARFGRPLQVLQLSGGGQNGAFGAGILNGWTESGRRPRFDIVTGISTGALLSTFAFLGTPEDDQTLKELFTGITKEDIYTSKGIVNVLAGGSSFYDTTPFARLLEKHVTEEVLARVAAEFDKGRALLVGTTNLDYNQLWIWNLARIAKDGGPGRLEKYRRILRAAASPPIAFPPVEIDGFLFADGATMDNLLIAGLMGPSSEFARATGAGRGASWVIHNGKLDKTPEAIRPGLLPIAGRTLTVMMDGQMASSLMRSYAVAVIHGYDWYGTHVPADFDVGTNALAFDQAEMKRLFEVGRKLGRTTETWLQRPPTSSEVAPWLIEAVGAFRK
jgi:hypothetical protein